MAVLPDRVLHPLTIDDYLTMVEHAPDDRFEGTELVEGVVYEVSPESPLHARAVRALVHGLERARPDADVMGWGSIRIGTGSLWNPDVYVVRPGAADDQSYPSAIDVELVVEVSVSTWSTDSVLKHRAYASAGIPEYWIVVPQPGGFVLRHRNPGADGYSSVDRFELPGGYAELDVAALLT
jgi:Uma2 family endonuclease